MFVESVKSGPAGLPFTADELKTHLRITGTDLDAQVDQVIPAAVAWWERRTGLAVMQQTRVRTWGCPGTRKLRLARPVTSITSVTVEGDTLTGFTPRPALGMVVLDEYQAGEVAVEYVCGFADAADVPNTWVLGMMQIAGHYVENTEAGAPIIITVVPLTAEHLAHICAEQNA